MLRCRFIPFDVVAFAQWQLVLFLLPSLLMALYIIIGGMTGSWLMFGVNLVALLFGIVPYLCVHMLHLNHY